MTNLIASSTAEAWGWVRRLAQVLLGMPSVPPLVPVRVPARRERLTIRP